MDLTDSECSEAGESGWTMYLNHSSASKDHFDGYYNRANEEEEEEEEEEDLSMVSDASSVPRYYCGDDEEFFDGHSYHSSLPLAKTSKNNKNKIKEQHGRFYQQHSCLEDTASSPVKGFSKNLSLPGNETTMQHAGFSQGFSATKFKGKSSMLKHLAFLQPSHVGKSASEEQGGSNQRRKRG